MRARIDISEVEAGTKIRAKYLRALENEEWDLLPGPVYVKSFLKTYGDYLGLDSRLLVDEFKRRYERPADHEVRAVSSAARERERRSATPGRVSALLLSPRSVIVVALVVIVAALWVIGNHGKNLATSGRTITPATNPTGSHHHRHHRRTAVGSGSASRTQATTSPTGTGAATSTTAKTTTTSAAQLATLTLAPTATVWICAENQAGRPLMPAVDYSPGQAIPTLKARQILVTLGNTSVTLTADGRPYPLSGGSVTNLRISPTAVTTSPTQFTCNG